MHVLVDWHSIDNDTAGSEQICATDFNDTHMLRDALYSLAIQSHFAATLILADEAPPDPSSDPRSVLDEYRHQVSGLLNLLASLAEYRCHEIVYTRGCATNSRFLTPSLGAHAMCTQILHDLVKSDRHSRWRIAVVQYPVERALEQVAQAHVEIVQKHLCAPTASAAFFQTFSLHKPSTNKQ